MQADGGLAGAGRTLDAQRATQLGTHQHVLLGLDGGDDVAHRSGPRALDLRLQDAAVLGPVRGGEFLVLQRRQLAVVETEAAPQAYPHRLAGPRPVERQRHRRAPVDHQRLATGLADDVATADIQTLVQVGAESAVVVQPTEEQRYLRIVLQGPHPPPQRLRQRLARHLVAALDPLAVQGFGGLAHPVQGGPGVAQVRAFGGQLGVGGMRIGHRCCFHPFGTWQRADIAVGDGSGNWIRGRRSTLDPPGCRCRIPHRRSLTG